MSTVVSVPQSAAGPCPALHPEGTSAAESRRVPALPDPQHVLLYHVSWPNYLKIQEALNNQPRLRLTYDQGTLEFMTTSSQHEIHKKWLGRFVEVIAEECQQPLAPGGSMTFQREEVERGWEADECYWIAQERRMRGKWTWHPDRDPPPDLIVEIEISRSAQPRMKLFAAFGVPEVWCFDGDSLRVYVLQPDRTYQRVERSPTFPALPLAELVRFLHPAEGIDYLSQVRAFRAWVREQVGKPAAGGTP